MAFFNDLIETMEKSPPDRVPPVPGATSTVLMYAPRRLRADRPDALQKAEGEIAYWRARPAAPRQADDAGSAHPPDCGGGAAGRMIVRTLAMTLALYPRLASVAP